MDNACSYAFMPQALRQTPDIMIIAKALAQRDRTMGYNCDNEP